MEKKRKLLAAAVLMVAILCACTDVQSGVLVKDVMIPGEDGMYTKAQIVMPSDYEDRKLPLVTLSHGFRGTMNSAGGESLARALAEHGIATIRMNFSRYVSADLSNGKIDSYTVRTMVEDQVLCTNYMIENYHVDPERIGLYGRSLGGRTAMIAANEKAGGFDYRAMVLVAPAGNGDAVQRYMGGPAKWREFRETAAREGSYIHQGVVLTPEFFNTVEAYVPSDHGVKFRRPVLVIRNTEDYVVLPEAAEECALCYPDHRLITVTTEKSPHGLEMGFKKSALKEKLFDEIIIFYQENLR